MHVSLIRFMVFLFRFLINSLMKSKEATMKFIANNYEPKEIIKIIREWTELTQKELAQEIGKSKDTIQSYESRNKMTLDTFMNIMKKYNLEVTIEKK